MLYFAYGSNMDWSQMRSRCPSANFFCVARLKDYRIAFSRFSKKRNSGVADAIRAPGEYVWGVVYEFQDAEIAGLDKCEGYNSERETEKNAYIREERMVCREGDENDPLKVHVYFAISDDKDRNFLPSPEYKKLIVEGAKYWHLPLHYIDILEQIRTTP
jgi:gamma-glutamylcyclotransferase (GGCT)/AIG2-like uncharacterized protein YtfP